MKIFFNLFTALFLVMSLFASCVDNDDSKAEATLMFQGVLEGVKFNVETNTELSESPDQYDSDVVEEEDTLDYLIEYVEEYLKDADIIGEGSVLTETAKVDYNNILAAQLICYNQAEEKYTNRFSKVSLYEIKRFIYGNHSEEMNAKGYDNYLAIPFESVKIKVSYYSPSDIGSITFERIYK